MSARHRKAKDRIRGSVAHVEHLQDKLAAYSLVRDDIEDEDVKIAVQRRIDVIEHEISAAENAVAAERQLAIDDGLHRLAAARAAKGRVRR